MPEQACSRSTGTILADLQRIVLTLRWCWLGVSVHPPPFDTGGERPSEGTYKRRIPSLGISTSPIGHTHVINIINMKHKSRDNLYLDIYDSTKLQVFESSLTKTSQVARIMVMSQGETF